MSGDGDVQSIPAVPCDFCDGPAIATDAPVQVCGAWQTIEVRCLVCGRYGYLVDLA